LTKHQMNATVKIALTDAETIERSHMFGHVDARLNNYKLVSNTVDADPNELV